MRQPAQAPTRIVPTPTPTIVVVPVPAQAEHTFPHGMSYGQWLEVCGVGAPRNSVTDALCDRPYLGH